MFERPSHLENISNTKNSFFFSREKAPDLSRIVRFTVDGNECPYRSKRIIKRSAYESRGFYWFSLFYFNEAAVEGGLQETGNEMKRVCEIVTGMNQFGTRN